MIKNSLLGIVVLCILSAPWISVQAQEAPDTPALHHQSADTCKLCHKEVYKDWRSSKHAQSTPLKGPLMKALYSQMGLDGRKEGQTTKEGAYPACLNCHAPNAALDQKTRLDTMPAYAEGVNCVACHRLADYLGVTDAEGMPRLGIQSYQPRGVPGQLQGPHGFSVVLKPGESEVGNPHLGQAILYHGKSIPSLPLEANVRQLKTAKACLGCHQSYKNASNISVCGFDMDMGADSHQADCQSCHMRSHQGLSQHAMGADAAKANLMQSLLLEVDLESRGSGVLAHLRLENRLPHAVPARTRGLRLELKAYDAQGQLLWDEVATDLVQTFLDDQGRPVLPQDASRQGGDGRLQAFEIRALDTQIAKAGVALVRAELYYHPLQPVLFKLLPGLPKELMASVLVGWAEARLQPSNP